MKWRVHVRGDQGFTITELLIVIVATGVLSTLLFTFTFNFWKTSYSQQSSLDSLSTRLNAGDILRSLVSSSTGMIVQTSIPDNNALAPDADEPDYWEEIHAIPDTISANDGDITPLVYFKRMSFDDNREIIFNGSTPYEDEYVLYIDGSERVLYLRSIANPNASGNALTTSCPPDNTTSTCPADRVVAENIASVDMRYFSRTGNPVDHTSVTDPETGEYIGPTYPFVEVAEFKLNITNKPPFQKTETTQVSTTIRVALRN